MNFFRLLAALGRSVCNVAQSVGKLVMWLNLYGLNLLSAQLV